LSDGRKKKKYIEMFGSFTEPFSSFQRWSFQPVNCAGKINKINISPGQTTPRRWFKHTTKLKFNTKQKFRPSASHWNPCRHLIAQSPSSDSRK